MAFTKVICKYKESIKKMLLAGHVAPSSQNIDLSHLLHLDVNDYIYAIYNSMLGRDPDREGFLANQRLICNGMPKEAIIYNISRSSEYADRYKICNLESYKRIYNRYITKHRILRIPVIGCLMSMCLNLYRLPRIMSDLEIKLSYLLENNEKTCLKKIDSLHSIFDLYRDELKEANKQNIGNALVNLKESILRDFEICLNRDEIIEANKRNIDNALVILRESILRDFEMINIKQHNMIPTLGWESIQSNLISAINNKYEEYDSYNLLPLEILYALAEDKTAVIGNYSYLFNNYANKNNFPEIKALEPNLTTLIKDVTGMDNIIISNVNLSSLILLSQKFLLELSQEIKGKLYLPVRTLKDTVCVLWEGFSYFEKSDEIYFRWAEGDIKKASIKLYNTTLSYVEAEVNFTSHALCGHGYLKIRGSFVQRCYDLSNPSNINIKFVLAPGENLIIFEFYGDIVIPKGDGRKLSFMISDFHCRVNGNEISQAALNYTYPVYLNDEYIRDTLHKSGFYEVSAKVYRNHGLFSKDLPVSKYLYPSGFLKQGQISDYNGSYDEITLYRAYRLESKKEDLYE